MRGAIDVTVGSPAQAMSMAGPPMVDTAPDGPEGVRLGVCPVPVQLGTIGSVSPMAGVPYVDAQPTTLPIGLFAGFG